MAREPVQLLGVVGGSPAVVTETVYALCVQPDAEEAETIGGLHLITTTHGEEKLQAQLYDQLRQMRRDYPMAAERIPDPANTTISIDVPKDYRTKEPLEDVRDTTSNAAMADRIHERVREMTGNDEPRLYASMAGGRKTMGYLLGHAMMCFGRAADRLTHVLTGECAEKCSDFFYPAPGSTTLETWEGVEFDASEQPVELHEIPFVRLRTGRKSGVDLPRSFVDVVRSAQKEVSGEAKLKVDLNSARVSYGGRRFRLSSTQLALYIVVAVEQAEGRGAIPSKAFVEGSSELRSVHLFNVYYEIIGEPEEREPFFSRGAKADVDKESGRSEFEKKKANLRRQMKLIRDWLNSEFPEFQVGKLEPRGRGGYSLGIDSEDIVIEGLERYYGEETQ